MLLLIHWLQHVLCSLSHFLILWVLKLILIVYTLNKLLIFLALNTSHILLFLLILYNLVSQKLLVLLFLSIFELKLVFLQIIFDVRAKTAVLDLCHVHILLSISLTLKRCLMQNFFLNTFELLSRFLLLFNIEVKCVLDHHFVIIGVLLVFNFFPLNHLVVSFLRQTHCFVHLLGSYLVPDQSVVHKSVMLLTFLEVQKRLVHSTAPRGINCPDQSKCIVQGFISEVVSLELVCSCLVQQLSELTEPVVLIVNQVYWESVHS